MSKCECRIKYDFRKGTWNAIGPSHLEIEFCPLHAASEKMLELLQAVATYSEVGPTFRKEVEDVIQKAEQGMK